MQNRVDSAQMRVPGYRDRIVHVKFTPREGGMNLAMPEKVIRRLTNRGREAGVKLVQRFDALPVPGALSWDNHRWVRFRSSLAVIAELVQRFADGYSKQPETPSEQTYGQLAARGWTEPPTSYRWDGGQGLLAAETTVQLIAIADALAASEESLREGAPRPEPEARIVPRV